MQYWKAQHDKKLLYGVMKHGWGDWEAIYSDNLLELETTLRLELGLPLPLPLQSQPSQSKLPFLPQNIPLLSMSPAAQAQSNQLPSSGSLSHLQQLQMHQPQVAKSQLPVTQLPQTQHSQSPVPQSQPGLPQGGPHQPKSESAPLTQAVKTESGSQSADGKAQLNQNMEKALEAVASSLHSGGAIKGEAEIVDVAMADAPELHDAAEPSHPSSTDAGSKEPERKTSTGVAVSQAAGPAAGPLDPSQQQLQQQSSSGMPASGGKPTASSTHLPQDQEITVKVMLLPQSDVSVQVKLDVMPSLVGVPAVRSSVPISTAASESMGVAALAAVSGQAAVPQAKTAVPTPQLGCAKCRYARSGCAQCREQLKRIYSPEEATRIMAEAGVAGQIKVWLLKRMSTLCVALKQRHQLNDSPQQHVQRAQQAQQTQHAVHVKQPVPIQQQPTNAPQMQASIPVMRSISVGQTTSAPVQTGGAATHRHPDRKHSGSAAVQTPGPAQQPWQQAAVQMSHLKQQQRMLQQRQALDQAQMQQQQRLLMQQQQRQQGAVLLLKQHQAAQQYQQQQQQQQRLAAQHQLHTQSTGQPASAQPRHAVAYATSAQNLQQQQMAPQTTMRVTGALDTASCYCSCVLNAITETASILSRLILLPAEAARMLVCTLYWKGH